MTIKRAYSMTVVKTVEEGDERYIEGIATTPTPDRMGDIVEPMGAKFALPLPLLWQHKHDEPVGHVEFAEPTKDGIPFKARLVKIAENGALRDRIENAWQTVKAGLIRGVSIGFSARFEDAEMMKDGGLRFKSWEWLELSLVTIPANADATIQTIKSISHDELAALGQSEKSGASDHKPVKIKINERSEDMNIAEIIASLEAKRAANAARMVEVMEKAAKSGETTDEAAQEEFETLETEIKTIDSELTRYRSLEAIQKHSAKPVQAAPASGSHSRAPSSVPARVRMEEKLDSGIGFARIAKVKAIARLDYESPRDIARSLYGENSSVYGHFVRTAVGAANTGDDEWAGNLGTDGGAFADFVEFLRPQTIVGKFGTGGIPAMRRLPFDTPVLIQDTGGDGYWVGEGKAKPLTSWTTSRTVLSPLKVATIAAVTEEMLRRSAIDADTWIRDELARAVIARIDMTFIDPTAAAVPGISPASITNGVTPIPSTGVDADAIRNDIRALSATFRTANNSTAGTVWIMGEATAEAVSMMTNPLGQSEFGGLGADGGSFMGKPVITSEYVTEGTVILVKAADIFFGDEGGVSVDFSREASLEMDDAPSHDSTTPTGSTSMVSMFQTNSVAFRAERTLNWMKRRAEAVTMLSGVDWGGEAP